MAMDTATKRYSAINLTSPWRGAGLLPSGTISATAMLALVFLYTGIAADVVQTTYVIFGSLVNRTPAVTIDSVTPDVEITDRHPGVSIDLVEVG